LFLIVKLINLANETIPKISSANSIFRRILLGQHDMDEDDDFPLFTSSLGDNNRKR